MIDWSNLGPKQTDLVIYYKAKTEEWVLAGFNDFGDKYVVGTFETEKEAEEVRASNLGLDLDGEFFI